MGVVKRTTASFTKKSRSYADEEYDYQKEPRGIACQPYQANCHILKEADLSHDLGEQKHAEEKENDFHVYRVKGVPKGDGPCPQQRHRPNEHGCPNLELYPPHPPDYYEGIYYEKY
jgi:hypothetical protein